MRVVTYLAVSVLAACIVGLAIYGPVDVVSGVPAITRAYTRWVPPTPPPQLEGLAALEREAFRGLGSQVDGRIVWSSNREGNHELYLVDLTTGEERRLTDHPHVEFFSRFSPDGTVISFLRSQREWVSFRENEAWDLFLMDANGGNERLVAREAYHPTWVPDGSGLVFVRQNRIIRYDLASDTETIVHHGADPPTGGWVEEPELLTDTLMCITLRDVPQETVGVLDLEARTYTPMSRTRECQITWVPGQRRVVWIEGEGCGGTRVMHASLDRADPQVLNRSSARVQPRVLPSRHGGRPMAHLGSGGGRPRARPRRLRAVRVEYRRALGDRPAAHVFGGQRSVARPMARRELR